MPLELRLLEHALAVGQHRNFARAAEALGLTQPSLSRSVASLEKALGVTLFDRTSKGVVPTAFGRVLLERSASVMQREADLRQEIRALAGLEAGTLAVSAGPYPAETIVAVAIGRLSKAYPRLQIRFIAADPPEIVRDVLAERIDIGVANADGLANESRLCIERLTPRRFHFACRPGHPLTREASPSLRRVLEFPLVTTVLRGGAAVVAASRGHRNAAEAGGAPDFVPQILVNSVALGLGVVRNSDAIFPAAAAHLADDLAAGRLVTLDCEVGTLAAAAGILHLRDRTLSPAAHAFVDLLRAVDAEKSGAETPATRVSRGTPRKGLADRNRR
jgi:DNA-binding transcriptional LysR family regulator